MGSLRRLFTGKSENWAKAATPWLVDKMISGVAEVKSKTKTVYSRGSPMGELVFTGRKEIPLTEGDKEEIARVLRSRGLQVEVPKPPSQAELDRQQKQREDEWRRQELAREQERLNRHFGG